MINDRKYAFNNISRLLAITRYDIEHHQSINDLSLNIHGENYFRDIFNFVYNANFINANSEDKNAKSIDLVDHKLKRMYQITTTRKKSKIENTLKIFEDNNYSGYEIKIYYLLDKPNPNKTTVDEIKNSHQINIKEYLKDYTDLLNDINDLETNKLIELNTLYFLNLESKYTENKVLNLVIKHLTQKRKHINKEYDDDFGSIKTDEKIKLNNINQRISSYINEGLDYQLLMLKLENEDNTLIDLKQFIINELYKDLLIDKLLKFIDYEDIKNSSIHELHIKCHEFSLDLNQIIYNLHNKIEDHMEIKDFNSLKISWIIIAHFFEICDIGLHE